MIKGLDWEYDMALYGAVRVIVDLWEMDWVQMMKFYRKESFD